MPLDKNKYIFELGKVLLHFGNLERAFKKTLYYICVSRVDKTKIDVISADKITARLSYSNMVDLFEDFLLDPDSEIKIPKIDVKKVTSSAREANNMRNDVVHSYFYDIPLGENLYKEKMRKKQKTHYGPEFREYKLEEIEKVNVKIMEAYFELRNFMRLHFEKAFR